MADDYSVEELLDRVDLVSIVSEHVKLRQQGTEYVGLCPFHQEKTPSFTITPSNQTYYCFGCQAGGNAFSFIKDHSGLSGSDAFDRLKQHAGINERTTATAAPIKRESVKTTDNWEPIMPVPDSAPKLMQQGKTSPIYNPKTDEYKTYKPEPEGVYPYRDHHGRLLGAVLRLYIKGKKITPTITYCVNTETGEEKWCLRGFPEPKPLYNIDRWHGNDTVLLVEGESCVDAAHPKLENQYDVVSWPNGTNSVDKADWSPLHGRNVVAWADHDDGGYKAMERIGAVLAENGGTFTLLNKPESKDKGWDCADAVEDGYDLAQYIQDHMPKRIAEQVDDEPIEQQDEPDQIVKPLGYDGSSFFYYSTLTQQLRELKDREHTESRMLGLADLEWWEMKFPKKTGFDSSAAASWMMSACRLKGIFDPKTIRGRGCWMDDGRFVVHLGDRLIVDNETKVLNHFKSKYLYQASRRKKAPHGAITNEQAKKILNVANAFDWEVKASGALMAGFCVLAPICGALEWRPQAWLTGGSRSGKSTVVKRFIKPLIGDMGYFTTLNTTAAGLRQKLKNDAIPSIIDEFDPKTRQFKERTEGYFALMRDTSDDSGNETFIGSPNGNADSFQMNTMFCLVGIQICTTEEAILNRTARLALRKKPSNTPEEKQKNFDDWAKLENIIDDGISSVDDISSRLLARTIGMFEIIQHNIKIFRKAASKHFGNARYGDQYGTLLAGAYSLASDCKIKEEAALRYIASFDWSSYTEDSDVDESDQAISSIMQIMLRVEGDASIQTRSVGEWVMYVHDKSIDSDRFGWKDVDDALKRCGIKCDSNGVIIANRCEFLKRELKNDPWGQNWGKYLKRSMNSKGYDDQPEKTIYFAPGLNSRGVLIPYSVLGDIGG